MVDRFARRIAVEELRGGRGNFDFDFIGLAERGDIDRIVPVRDRPARRAVSAGTPVDPAQTPASVFEADRAAGPLEDRSMEASGALSDPAEEDEFSGLSGIALEEEFGAPESGATTHEGAASDFVSKGGNDATRPAPEVEAEGSLAERGVEP